MKIKALNILIFILICFQSHSQPLDLNIGCHHAQSFRSENHNRERTIIEQQQIENSNKRSDSIDIINYSIYLNITEVTAKKITAHTKVSFLTKLDNIDGMSLDLKQLNVDSILFEGQKIQFNYDSSVVVLFFGKQLNKDYASSVEVYYQGIPKKDPVWGGVYFVDKYIYNLGIGLSTTPPNFGKVWFPCFDNFVERSTYDYYVTSTLPSRAYCAGHLVTEDSISPSSVMRHYRMDFNIPTYLSNFAASDYVVDRSLTNSLSNPNLPIDLIARPSEIGKMKVQLAGIPDAVDAFEFWFGPYRFERVGFVATTVGAMEHPTNTSYPISSVTSGTLTDNEKLFAHEFGHQWWGNLTTLDDARDMWIKEGNAEYSSHLYFEYVYGVEKFRDVVRDNLAFILFNAHLNDGDFLPLSPMPYDQTYGTHTYRKGAAMIHNLRAYLGDSLYRTTCHTIFDSLTGKSMNAYEFRDFINRNSPVKVDNYFDDYIFNRGYTGFYIDSIIQSPILSKNVFSLNIKQKKYHADHLCTDVPLRLSCYSHNMERREIEIRVSDESTWVEVEFPMNFLPDLFLLNEHQTLNYASIQDNAVVNATGTLPLAGTSMSPAVAEITDSAYINIVHHLVGPSEGRKKNNILKLSETHFWQVSALPRGKLKMTGRVDYNGSTNKSLDYEILKSGEDSVVLAYRKNFEDDWRVYQPATKLKVTPNDTRGFIRIDDMVPGEYALAYGYAPLVNTSVEEIHKISIFPNPASEKIRVEGSILNEVGGYAIYTTDGRIAIQTKLENSNNILIVPIQKLFQGNYSLVLFDKNNRFVAEENFSVVK